MAANTLQAFSNDAFGTIRTIEADGKVYFCGRDVATALGYANPNKAIQDHCKGVPFRYPLDTPGGIQQVRFITEGDLYRLIMSSKLPAAQQFEAWVVDEVLPTIRRHGMYAIDELLANDEFLEQVIVQLRAERAKRLAAEQALLEAAPKVSYYDIVLQSDSLLTTTEIAKDYGLSAKRMNRILHEQGVQFRQSGRWFLYARFAEQGYTQSKTHEYDEGKTRTHMYWTQKGRLFIYDLLKNQLGLLPVIEKNGGDAQ
ncbi:phage antirepressor KilAC domain-containing protein [Trueperella pecoris]|uniref:Phage antirepressor KilAC domain-containing protein n=1 Tax=Trueperella pecoris TaxID=2733571 RepID=A0A7M1QXZ7_9ACTO|nr:phage antirepressor KilAC domain-containing protein [Trueperella pecoris]QOR46920.1 phage antirepressor KilAC domain-containing protein [Trueperella pecoris]